MTPTGAVELYMEWAIAIEERVNEAYHKAGRMK